MLELMVDRATAAGGLLKLPSQVKILADAAEEPEPGDSELVLAQKAAKPWLDEIEKFGRDKKKLIGMVKIPK